MNLFNFRRREQRPENDTEFIEKFRELERRTERLERQMGELELKIKSLEAGEVALKARVAVQDARNAASITALQAQVADLLKGGDPAVAAKEIQSVIDDMATVDPAPTPTPPPAA